MLYLLQACMESIITWFWMLRHLWILLFRLIDLKSHWIRCVWYSWKNNISLTSLKIFRNWIYLLSKDQRKEVRKRSSGTELRQTTLCGFNQAAACLQCGGNPSQQSSSCSESVKAKYDSLGFPGFFSKYCFCNKYSDNEIKLSCNSQYMLVMEIHTYVGRERNTRNARDTYWVLWFQCKINLHIRLPQCTDQSFLAIGLVHNNET